MSERQEASYFNLLELFRSYCALSTLAGNADEHRRRVDAMLQVAWSKGLTGCNVLPLLRTFAERHRGDLAEATWFAQFYRFVFLVARTPGQRNLAVDSALAAWSMCLDRRFPLLERFCSFVRCHRRHVVTEDTWMQVMEFSRCVRSDLTNYDPHGAWPVLIDDFVDWSTTNTAARRSCPSDAMLEEAGDTVRALHGDFEFNPVFRSGVKRPCSEEPENAQVAGIAARLANLESPSPTTKRARTHSGLALAVGPAFGPALIGAATDDHHNTPGRPRPRQTLQES